MWQCGWYLVFAVIRRIEAHERANDNTIPVNGIRVAGAYMMPHKGVMPPTCRRNETNAYDPAQFIINLFIGIEKR